VKQVFPSHDQTVCVSVDASRFDQHVAASVLSIEHSVYLKSNNDPYFALLLKQQLSNTCFTRGGIKYQTKGKRMSGDMNTALGNCVLMIAMVLSALRHIGLTKYEIFDDGDDCLILVEREHLETLIKCLPAEFLNYGQELKVENIAYTMEEIQWCTCKPVLDADGDYRMCTLPFRCMSQTAAGAVHWTQNRKEDMAYSVGQCILAVYPGMPIVQKYATRLCLQGKLHKDLDNIDWILKVAPTKMLSQLGNLSGVPVDIESRTSFFKAFGIDEIEQLRIEQILEDWIPFEDADVIPDIGHYIKTNWNIDPVHGCTPADRDVIPQRHYAY